MYNSKLLCALNEHKSHCGVLNCKNHFWKVCILG